MRSLLLLLAIGAGISGCESKPPTPDPAPAATSASAAPLAAPAPALPSAQHPADSAPPAKADLPACKALDKQRLVGLGTRTAAPAGLIARDGNVYFLGFKQELARAELVRFPRDGAKPVELGRYKGLGKPESFRLNASAAFFCMKQSLISIPLAGGEAVELAKGFSKIAAPNQRHVYGVRCDTRAGADQLVRVELSGGEVEVAASWPRSKGSTVCDYKQIALDESNAYLADWGSRRLLAVSLSEGTLRELTRGQAYIDGLVMEPDSVVYNAQAGVFRVAKRGGEPKRLSELGESPFSFFASDERALYVLQTGAYAQRNFIVRIPHDGGKAEEIESFVVKDVVMGAGVTNISLDDDCVYFAHSRERYLEIMARPR